MISERGRRRKTEDKEEYIGLTDLAAVPLKEIREVSDELMNSPPSQLGNSPVSF